MNTKQKILYVGLAINGIEIPAVKRKKCLFECCYGDPDHIDDAFLVSAETVSFKKVRENIETNCIGLFGSESAKSPIVWVNVRGGKEGFLYARSGDTIEFRKHFIVINGSGKANLFINAMFEGKEVPGEKRRRVVCKSVGDDVGENVLRIRKKDVIFRFENNATVDSIGVFTSETSEHPMRLACIDSAISYRTDGNQEIFVKAGDDINLDHVLIYI